MKLFPDPSLNSFTYVNDIIHRCREASGRAITYGTLVRTSAARRV